MPPGSAFRRKAEEARRLQQQARRSAEQAGAESAPAFAEGVELERQGDGALAAGQAPSQPAVSWRPAGSSSEPAASPASPDTRFARPAHDARVVRFRQFHT